MVRSLSYELAVNSGVETRLIAFDVGTGRYFALADPILIRSADGLGDIGREARAAQGLVKIYEHGASVWRQREAAPDAPGDVQAD